MKEVKVYYTGEIEIEDVRSSLATQQLFFSSPYGKGIMYYCEDDKVEDYKKKAIDDIIMQKEKEIENLKQELINFKMKVGEN